MSKSWQDEFDEYFGELIYVGTETRMANRHIKAFIQDLLDRKAREIEGLRKEPFIEATDNDSHRYQIPHSKREDWIRWCEIGEKDSEDPLGWETPAYAERIDGMPITDTRLFNQALDQAISILKEE